MKFTHRKAMRICCLSALGLILSVATNAAISAVVVVVSAKSAITTLTKSEVSDLFLGKASRFPDGSRVVPVDQAEGSAARDQFYMAFTGRTAAQMKAFWSKIIFTGRGDPLKTVSSAADLTKLIHADPTVIGYIDKTLVDGGLRIVR